jgi:hypothetical protein
MARRKSSVFDDLVHVASIIPWWANVALAVLTYGGLHYLAGQKLDPHAVKSVENLGHFIHSSYIQVFATFLQYIIPAVFLLGALAGFVKRSATNNEQPSPTLVNSTGTSCPDCGSSMVKRKARRGANAGGEFWGCSTYPKCRGTRPI